MRLDQYPAQEPLSEAARHYTREVMERGAGVGGGEEFHYGDDPYQSLLVYRPAKPNGTLLAFFHGGGWTNGYKEWMTFMAPCFVEAGTTFATIGYRLAPSHIFPVGFEDACAGVAWLAAQAANYGVDPDRLFVGGHSAGGHYAALMALTKKHLRIRGCLPLSGVYDFGPHSGLSARPRFLGAADSGADAAASPILQIGARPCPFLLAYGSQDFPHLMRQAERMKDKLAAAGGDVERIVLEGRSHFSASYAAGESDGPWVSKAIAWIGRHS
jgi:arylformamidase